MASVAATAENTVPPRVIRGETPRPGAASGKTPQLEPSTLEPSVYSFIFKHSLRQQNHAPCC